MIISMIGTLAGLVGFIFAFINPVVTIICALITLIDSVTQVVSGAQKDFFSEIASIILGVVIALIAGASWYVGAAAGLCLGSFLFWLVGVFALLVSRKH